MHLHSIIALSSKLSDLFTLLLDYDRSDFPSQQLYLDAVLKAIAHFQHGALPCLALCRIVNSCVCTTLTQLSSLRVRSRIPVLAPIFAASSSSGQMRVWDDRALGDTKTKLRACAQLTAWIESKLAACLLNDVTAERGFCCQELELLLPTGAMQAFFLCSELPDKLRVAAATTTARTLAIARSHSIHRHDSSVEPESDPSLDDIMLAMTMPGDPQISDDKNDVVVIRPTQEPSSWPSSSICWFSLSMHADTLRTSSFQSISSSFDTSLVRLKSLLLPSDSSASSSYSSVTSLSYAVFVALVDVVVELFLAQSRHGNCDISTILSLDLTWPIHAETEIATRRFPAHFLSSLFRAQADFQISNFACVMRRWLVSMCDHIVDDGVCLPLTLAVLRHLGVPENDLKTIKLFYSEPAVLSSSLFSSSVDFQGQRRATALRCFFERARAVLSAATSSSSSSSSMALTIETVQQVVTGLDLCMIRNRRELMDLADRDTLDGYIVFCFSIIGALITSLPSVVYSRISLSSLLPYYVDLFLTRWLHDPHHPAHHHLEVLLSPLLLCICQFFLASSAYLKRVVVQSIFELHFAQFVCRSCSHDHRHMRIDNATHFATSFGRVSAAFEARADCIAEALADARCLMTSRTFILRTIIGFYLDVTHATWPAFLTMLRFTLCFLRLLVTKMHARNELECMSALQAVAYPLLCCLAHASETAVRRELLDFVYKMARLIEINRRSRSWSPTYITV